VTALGITIVAVALANAATKAIGPILVRGRELPPSVGAIIALLAPALLVALVVTETFGKDGWLVLDERAVGVAVAAVALALRAPVLLAVVLAALWPQLWPGLSAEMHSAKGYMETKYRATRNVLRSTLPLPLPCADRGLVTNKHEMSSEPPPF
jgi:hypothetical protein